MNENNSLNMSVSSGGSSSSMNLKKKAAANAASATTSNTDEPSGKKHKGNNNNENAKSVNQNIVYRSEARVLQAVELDAFKVKGEVEDEEVLGAMNNITLQYSSLYGDRLKRLGPRVREVCKRKWMSSTSPSLPCNNIIKECERIAGIAESTGTLINNESSSSSKEGEVNGKGKGVKMEVDNLEASHVSNSSSEDGGNAPLLWVVGTVYMDMPLKESILDEISREEWVTAPPPREKYTSPLLDKVILEDESGRVILSSSFGDEEEVGGGEGILNSYVLSTGMIVGVLGRVTPTGTFHVIDLCFPGPNGIVGQGQAYIPSGVTLDLTQPRKTEEEDDEEGDTYLALLSGLEIDGSGTLDFKLELFMDWLSGEVGSPESRKIQSKIVHLLVLGNNLSPPTEAETQRRTKKNKFGRSTVEYDPVPLESLDLFLKGVCSGMEVSLMPGGKDPTSHLLPQRPFHPSLFKEGGRFNTLKNIPNPCTFGLEVGKELSEDKGKGVVEVVGMAGEVIDDIFKYVDTWNRLDITASLLASGLTSPTSPDTLWTLPTPHDPFLLKRCPNLWIVGNQPSFETKCIFGRGEVGIGGGGGGRVTKTKVKSERPKKEGNVGEATQGEAGDAEMKGVEGKEEEGGKMEEGTEVEAEDEEDVIEEDGEGKVNEVCRIIHVPKFHETGEVILVNLRTLKPRQIYF